MRIIAGDLNNPRVRALFEHHVATARAETAPGSAHALDVESLKASDVSFWAAWEDDALLAVGALKRLSNDHGEIKSMHTAEGEKAWERRCFSTSSKLLAQWGYSG